MTTYTARQLRTIADRLEGLTKARQSNETMGVPTTPDHFPARFPSGHQGGVVWEQAGLTSAAARERGEAPWRYVVDLGPNDPAPSAAKDGPAGVISVSQELRPVVSIEGSVTPDAVSEAVRRIARAGLGA